MNRPADLNRGTTTQHSKKQMCFLDALSCNSQFILVTINNKVKKAKCLVPSAARFDWSYFAIAKHKAPQINPVHNEIERLIRHHSKNLSVLQDPAHICELAQSMPFRGLEDQHLGESTQS